MEAFAMRDRTDNYVCTDLGNFNIDMIYLNQYFPCFICTSFYDSFLNQLITLVIFHL